MKLLMRFVAFISGKKLIYLKDHDGEIRITMMKTDPWGDVVANVYPLVKVGWVKLLPNGEVQQPHYCSQWKEVEPLINWKFWKKS